MSRFPEIWAGRRHSVMWLTNFLEIVKSVIRHLKSVSGREAMLSTWGEARLPIPDSRFQMPDFKISNRVSWLARASSRSRFPEIWVGQRRSVMWLTNFLEIVKSVIRHLKSVSGREAMLSTWGEARLPIPDSRFQMPDFKISNRGSWLPRAASRSRFPEIWVGQRRSVMWLTNFLEIVKSVIRHLKSVSGREAMLSTWGEARRPIPDSRFPMPDFNISNRGSWLPRAASRSRFPEIWVGQRRSVMWLT